MRSQPLPRLCGCRERGVSARGRTRRAPAPRRARERPTARRSARGGQADAPLPPCAVPLHVRLERVDAPDAPLLAARRGALAAELDEVVERRLRRAVDERVRDGDVALVLPCFVGGEKGSGRCSGDGSVGVAGGGGGGRGGGDGRRTEGQGRRDDAPAADEAVVRNGVGAQEAARRVGLLEGHVDPLGGGRDGPPGGGLVRGEHGRVAACWCRVASGGAPGERDRERER